MRKTIAILATTAAALTSTALFSTGALAQSGAQRFVHEGKTYVYTSTVANGRQVIEGHRFPGNEPFRLIVAGKRVSGTSNGVPVSFKTDDARGAAGSVQLAAE